MSDSSRIRALNALLPQGIARWKLSSAEALEDAAIRSTGNRAELTTTSREALEVLLQSYQKTAQLHPLGEIMTAVNILSLLKQQLRLSAEVAAMPAISARAITTPLIITGLPRTGSTLLHNLLALDPQWRVPLSWEVTHPAPIAQKRQTEQLRVAMTRLRFSLLETLRPGFRAIHELDPNLPQECLVITAAAMRSHLFFSSTFVPGYQDWLDEQDQTAIYDQHRVFLQFLQTDTNTIWALKAPSHLFALDGLLTAYPDARIVHTLRAPEAVIGSIASLHWHLYRTFSTFSDRQELGNQICKRWSKAHNDFAQKLTESTALQQQVFTLNYDKFVADPVLQIGALYRYFDLQLTTAVAKEMQQYVQHRPQHQFGKHRYNLADYGLSANVVRRAFNS